MKERGPSNLNLLPEGTTYQDTGCSYAPKCLECPLPACRYELPPRRAWAIMRSAAVRANIAQGLTTDEIVAKLTMSRRTVFRLKRP